MVERDPQLERLSLGHLQLPAEKPAELARWYAEQLDFKVHGLHMRSGGSLIVFVEGNPLQNKQVHFGFRLSSKEAVLIWHRDLKRKNLSLGEMEGNELYQAFRIHDPEGNEIEFFWQETPSHFGIGA